MRTAKQKRSGNRGKQASKAKNLFVAEPPPPAYAAAASRARVFQSGNSQAVRLPKAFRFKSKTIEIFRRGDEVVLREKPIKLSALLLRLPRLPEDALPDEIPDDPPEPVEEW